MSFKEITLQEISKVTSFSRPTIYNYFQTKEEIFVSLMASGITDSSLAYHLQNAKVHGVTKEEIAASVSESDLKKWAENLI